MNKLDHVHRGEYGSSKDWREERESVNSKNLKQGGRRVRCKRQERMAFSTDVKIYRSNIP